jgi:hypothetical protein
MIYYLSSNNTNSVGEAPLYRCAPWSLGQVIRRIHISVTGASERLNEIGNHVKESPSG